MSALPSAQLPVARAMVFFLAILLGGAALPSASRAQTDFMTPMAVFVTVQDAVARLLPNAEVLTQHDITLDARQIARLEKSKNWDTAETEFTLYHEKNQKRQILRTVVIFPEITRHGTIKVAVALSNDGKILGALVLEAQNKTVQWLRPLLRAGYMDTFTGKDRTLPLRLEGEFKSAKYSTVTQNYALVLANVVKKSAQLFSVVFKR